MNWKIVSEHVMHWSHRLRCVSTDGHGHRCVSMLLNPMTTPRGSGFHDTVSSRRESKPNKETIQRTHTLPKCRNQTSSRILTKIHRRPAPVKLIKKYSGETLEQVES